MAEDRRVKITDVTAYRDPVFICSMRSVSPEIKSQVLHLAGQIAHIAQTLQTISLELSQSSVPLTHPAFL